MRYLVPIYRTISAGARAAYIIKEPVVAAIGADIPIGSPSGRMIIDIGGGTSEIAVISFGGIVSSQSVRIGKNKFNAAIQEHVRRKYGLAIGERTSEDIKIRIGSALYLEKKLEMHVKGRDMISGLPRVIAVTSDIKELNGQCKKALLDELCNTFEDELFRKIQVLKQNCNQVFLMEIILGIRLCLMRKSITTNKNAVRCL